MEMVSWSAKITVTDFNQTVKQLVVAACNCQLEGVNLAQNVLELVHGTKDKEGSQLWNFCLMTDGEGSDSLRKSHLRRVHHFQRDETETESMTEENDVILMHRHSYEGIWLISTLQTPEAPDHRLMSQSLLSVYLSIKAILQDMTSFLAYAVTDDSYYGWHPVRAITVPSGKGTSTLTNLYTDRMRNNGHRDRPTPKIMV